MVRSRRARVADVRAVAEAMPHVKVIDGSQDRPIFQVGGRSFVFFRNPRPDAHDPETGIPYDDVICVWTESKEEKDALVQSPGPWFTTSHFDGYNAVLLRESRIGELTLAELTEVIQDAWLTRASPARRRTWLAEHALAD